MKVPDDMVERWKESVRKRQKEENTADQIQAKQDRRDLLVFTLSGLTIGLALIWLVLILSLPQIPPS